MESDPTNGKPTKPNPKLTVKQSKFVAAYLDPAAANGNGTLAAKLAGHQGNNNVLAVQASTNLRNPKIQQIISAGLEPLIPRAFACLGEALDATTSENFLAKDGNIVTTPPVPDHKVKVEASKVVFGLASKFGVAGSEPEPMGPTNPGAPPDGNDSGTTNPGAPLDGNDSGTANPGAPLDGNDSGTANPGAPLNRNDSGTAVQWEDLEPGDRALISELRKIDAELDDIDLHSGDHGGDEHGDHSDHAQQDHSSPESEPWPADNGGTDHAGDQDHHNSSTAALRTEPAETEPELAHDDGNRGDAQVEQPLSCSKPVDVGPIGGGDGGNVLSGGKSEPDN
jgi:hypothetical protein